MNDPHAAFQQHVPRLRAIAYRMLGTQADADDMLQETWLRWQRSDTSQIEEPEAWLVTTVTRLCIDRLRAVKKERETYFGPWLPEPLVGHAPPADAQAELASELSVAFLVVLERLAPEERAAFLLHDVFDCGYAEIARMLGRNEASCRQMVHRARERVRRDKPRFQVSEQAHRRLLQRFLDALRTGSHEALLELFAEDVTWTADGGGKVPASSKVVTGRERVAKLLAGVSRVLLQPRLEKLAFEFAPINRTTGIIAWFEGRPLWALSLETDGVHVLAGYNIINPDKLVRIRRPA